MRVQRLRQWARSFKAQLIVLYLVARHPQTPWYVKALAAVIVLVWLVAAGGVAYLLLARPSSVASCAPRPVGGVGGRAGVFDAA